MNWNLQRSTLHAKALASAFLHLLMTDESNIAPDGAVIWSHQDKALGSLRYEVRLMPDHSFRATCDCDNERESTPRYETFEHAVARVIDLIHQGHQCDGESTVDGVIWRNEPDAVAISG